MTAPTVAIPFDPSTLQPPLSVTQRTRIIEWITIESFSDQISGAPSPASMQAMNDADLIKTYQEIIALGKFSNTPITGPPNPLGGWDGIKNLLLFLLNPIRMGEIIVGTILIGVAVSAMFRGSPPARAATSIYGKVNR